MDGPAQRLDPDFVGSITVIPTPTGFFATFVNYKTPGLIKRLDWAHPGAEASWKVWRDTKFEAFPLDDFSIDQVRSLLGTISLHTHRKKKIIESCGTRVKTTPASRCSFFMPSQLNLMELHLVCSMVRCSRFRPIENTSEGDRETDQTPFRQGTEATMCRLCHSSRLCSWHLHTNLAVLSRYPTFGVAQSSAQVGVKLVSKRRKGTQWTISYLRR